LTYLLVGLQGIERNACNSAEHDQARKVYGPSSWKEVMIIFIHRQHWHTL